MLKLFVVAIISLVPLMLSAQLHNPDEFKQCLNRLEQQALQSGRTKKTVDAALGEAVFLSEVIELDRYQPEFNRTFAGYLGRAVSDERLERGKAFLKQYRTLLDKLAVRYGVPPHTLVAFWGLESNFGQNLGQFKVIDSLVTLACDKRRSAFFSAELMAALELMDKYGFEREQLVGSWAGAVGHTQFLPSNYLRYAVSHKRSGTPDLWQNIPDALTSAANFLQQLGWQKGWKWGREVYLPKNFDYKLAGLSKRKSLEEWHQLGIRTVFHDRIPEKQIAASLLIPGGHQSTAFLVYDNFEVILKWNRSVLYGLSVGYLADRLNGHRPLSVSPKEEAPLGKNHIMALQSKLNMMGFSCGKADGIIGASTREAISEFQSSKKMIADGYPSKPVFDALGVNINL